MEGNQALRKTLERVLERRIRNLDPRWSMSGQDLALEVEAACLPQVALVLRDDPGAGFAYLACITGIDRFPEEPRFEVVYHLRALERHERLVVRARVPGEDPRVPSLVDVWKAADWFEREIFDLLGISFPGHPDLRRLLLPSDWEGHPLRKDYPLEGRAGQ